MEIESSPLRRAAIFVSNVPKGRTLGFIAGGRRGQKKNALQATILRITRGLWTVNSKSKPWLYFMKCSIPRDITNKQKICSLRVKKTRFRNCVCRFCFMLCSLPRVSTSKQKNVFSARKKERVFATVFADPGFRVIVAIILTRCGFGAIAIVRIEPACMATVWKERGRENLGTRKRDGHARPSRSRAPQSHG